MLRWIARLQEVFCYFVGRVEIVRLITLRSHMENRGKTLLRVSNFLGSTMACKIFGNMQIVYILCATGEK